jgi:hypothetical protein
MLNAQRFNFTEGFDTFGVPDALPQLPLSLTYRDSSTEVLALLDTGASVDVLPYSVGVQLGAIWEEQRRKIEAFFSLKLTQVTREKKTLEEVMSDISQKAQERGLTPEILDSILNEQ